jgi:hypothetical protein
MRGASSPSISAIPIGVDVDLADGATPDSSSAYVFQALHAEQRPSHLVA